MRRTSSAAAILFAAILPIGCTVTTTPLFTERDGGLDAGPVDAAIDAAPIDGGFVCAPGVLACFGNTLYTCGSDGVSRDNEVVCPDACDPTLGCVTCVAGSRRCDGSVSMLCDADGEGWSFGRDCADWEVECGAGGYCEDACAGAEASRSYVGCEYFASPLANYPDIEPRGFDFRLVVTNPNGRPAEVTITHGRRLVVRETIVPGGVAEIPLPWIDGVSFPFEEGTLGWESRVVADGAYRLISNQPVIVAQFNPFHYARPGQLSYTNDASLLLPVHALGTEYIGLSYPPLSAGTGDDGSGWPGYLALVGTTPEPANVELTPTVAVAADAEGRWPATEAGVVLRFALARGEIAQITPAVPPICGPARPGFSPVVPGNPDAGGYCYEADHDLTGSRIVSDRPIAAWGGHTCAFVPFDTPACDHLETTLAPLDTWGSQFETMPLRDPETDVENLVRIVAGHDGTTITLDPPQRLDPALVLDAGEHVDIMIAEAVSIVASQPVQVAQFLLGQNARTPPLERGDPGLTILVPQEQFRVEYVFVTPSSYVATVGGQSWVLASREPGVEIILDGAPVDAEWTRVGERELALVEVAGGSHRATSSASFGLIAFGLGSYTSYAYPAGLDLRQIPF